MRLVDGICPVVGESVGRYADDEDKEWDDSDDVECRDSAQEY